MRSVIIDSKGITSTLTDGLYVEYVPLYISGGLYNGHRRFLVRPNGWFNITEIFAHVGRERETNVPCRRFVDDSVRLIDIKSALY